jgi:hypothetical protein
LVQRGSKFCFVVVLVVQLLFLLFLLGRHYSEYCIIAQFHHAFSILHHPDRKNGINLIPSRYHWDQLDAKLTVLDINFPVRIAYSLARQTCPAALPGSLARQPCPAVLPGSLARQPYPTFLKSLIFFTEFVLKLSAVCSITCKT